MQRGSNGNEEGGIGHSSHVAEVALIRPLAVFPCDRQGVFAGQGILEGGAVEHGLIERRFDFERTSVPFPATWTDFFKTEDRASKGLVLRTRPGAPTREKTKGGWTGS